MAASIFEAMGLFPSSSADSLSSSSMNDKFY